MSKNSENDLYGTTFSIESMKVIAESIGIANLPDDAAKELADDISYRLKHIIQDAAKFMHHARRNKLMYPDIDATLKVKNIEPQYGFHSVDSLPFRFASGGGRELHFIEEKEVDLNEFVTNVNVKAPLEVTLRSHWLCIDGVQPTTPENPPPQDKEMQKLESVDPINKMNKPNKESSGKPTTGKQKLRNVETVQIKQLATHELSVEQQLYYKEITEACVGSDETRRIEALQSLASDPGLHEMLPRMCTFIIEGVRVNVVQNNLALLIYLMRMVKALLDNQSLFLEKYLHELIPSVTTCIVSKQLCTRPEFDNHWALRDFASRLMAQICKNFNTSTNNIQTRVTRMFTNSLQQGDKLPLSSLYGALHGLSELGTEVIKTFILPRIKTIGSRIEVHLEGSLVSNLDKVASGHIKALLVKVLAPIIKNLRSPPDYFEEYKTDYGYLGPALQSAVMKARTQPAQPITPANTSIAPVSATISRSITAPMGMMQQGIVRGSPFGDASVIQNRVAAVPKPIAKQDFSNSFQKLNERCEKSTVTPGRTIVMNQPNRGTPTGSNQKFVFVTQRSQTPGNVQPSVQTQPNTVVKIMANTPSPNSQPKVVNAPQKLVVVSMPTSGTTSTVAISTQNSQTQGVISQSNLHAGNIVNVGANQPPFSVVQKSNFVQQQQKPKQEPAPNVDDLSHLA